MLIHAESRGTSDFIGFVLRKALNNIGLKCLGGPCSMKTGTMSTPWPMMPGLHEVFKSGHLEI
jgi:hypothetical protein